MRNKGKLGTRLRMKKRKIKRMERERVNEKQR